MLCSKIIYYLNKIAPESSALEWDNVGLIIGNKNCEIKKIIIGLDLTDDLIKQAIDQKANLIITHHPIFFKSINKLASDSSRETQRAIELIKNNICLYVAHTNLDIAPKGVNYALFNLLELNNDKVEYLSYDKNNLISRIGFLKQETILKEFACFAKKKLLLEKINFYGNANYKIKKVAVCSGSGAGHNYFVAAKEKNCDVYLTGDIKYHAALEAIDLNLNLIDITHWASERIFANVLADELMHYINFEKENDLTIITQKYNNDFINII